MASLSAPGPDLLPYGTMHYNRVHLEAIGYELPPVVVSTADLERRLAPLYNAHRMSDGQLELLTGLPEPLVRAHAPETRP